MPIKDPEERRKYSRERYRIPEVRNKAIESQRKYRKEHREDYNKYIREYKRNYRQNIRKKIFDLLGGCCANPYGLHDKPFTDIRCLQIDHVNGGGKKEYKKLRCGSGNERFLNEVFRKIKAGSKDYQCLCANCNWIKRFEKGEKRPRILM